MVFKPNYSFQKAERQKAKQSRKEQKAREKEQRKGDGPGDEATAVPAHADMPDEQPKTA